MHYAVIYGRYRMLDFLLSLNVDVQRPDKEGKTALDHAKRLRRDAYVLRLEQALAAKE